MWSASKDPSSGMESGSPEAVVHTKETCEQNKNQLESLKDIMMRNQQSLKKKEEEVQEYARRLSKIKSRAKMSRRNKEEASSSKDTMHLHKTESKIDDTTDNAIVDISQAKTPKAKSSLLQRKLAENRKAFEQRSKELTETKRAVEEKVEAMRQQLEETDLTVMEINKDQWASSQIRSLVITSDDNREKEYKIIEMNNKILELEATVLDLRENLKEKDAVIDSKTKAVTLVSADFSKKGKTTLDTLEDTKDEMRMMQENFILIETSLKDKNTSLLEQLQERDNRILELEHTVNRFEEQLREQKLAESVSADFSRSTMDTLVETKDAMKSMQENFVLIESSLKLKNQNLLQQLGEYETKLAETKERILQLELESGPNTANTIQPMFEEFRFKMEQLELSNRQLLDEKYELQKNIAEMQDQILTSRSVHRNNVVSEKDQRITELENLIESKTAEWQKRTTELSSKKEEYYDKIIDLEKQLHELQVEKNELSTRLSDERTESKESDKVMKLTKELEELNKSIIKLKTQHKSKVKNLQKQLENIKMVSDTNAELIRLGNQVTLLEEEKGNLQLSLVDFDELKASAGDWQEHVADLESKISSQTKEIQMHVDAIAILENQKLDLMQELYMTKREISVLEAENAESENLRVTAEMKVVELEEQLEAIHKEQSENKLESLSDPEYSELLKKIDALTHENSELYNKLSKIEEKGASDTGSTESFEAIQVNDRNDLLKKIEELEQKNNELTLKVTKLEEKDSSHAGSTESFETINDIDRCELLKKIEQLTQENSDLTIKLSRIEEKGSSDTGSTESFERIPEHNESTMKIELLTQENNELVIKLTKLEEQLSQMKSNVQPSLSKSDDVSETLEDARDLRAQIVETLKRENDSLMEKISKFEKQVGDLTEENKELQSLVEALKTENADLIREKPESLKMSPAEPALEIKNVTETQQVLEKELHSETSKKDQAEEVSIEQSVIMTDDAKFKIATLEEENARLTMKIAQLEKYVNSQKEELSKIIEEKETLHLKMEQTACDDFAGERLMLIEKLEKLYREKEDIAQEKQELHEQISTLLQKSSDESAELRKMEQEAADRESQIAIVTSLKTEVENNKISIVEYKNQIEDMNMILKSMEVELQEKARQLVEYKASGAKMEGFERELKDTLIVAEEWKGKYYDMEIKVEGLEREKASIEETLKILESGNKELLEVINKKNAATSLQDRFQDVVELLETRLQDETANVTAKEREISDLKKIIENKDQELHVKYAQLQNEMINIDSLQDELTNYTIKVKENEAALSSLLNEITGLNDTIKEREVEILTLKNNINEINKALEQSKSLTEFHEILDNLHDKETSYNELQSKYEDILKENGDLLRKLERMSERDKEINNELIKKEQELASMLIAKENLDTQIEEIKHEKLTAEKEIWHQQKILDDQNVYVKQVQSDLTNEYKKMEQLKMKHTEDIAMLNQRLEDVIEELSAKMQENEAMRAELEQKKESLDKNVTEELKINLEDKVADLEQKLTESEDKLQAQSEKMKKIVATFNKKKMMCQELEARVVELEEKWMTEKDEKEVKNKRIQEVENSMREKDNKIADLEEELLQVNKDMAEALANSEKLTKESISLKEKMAVLMEQVAEMDEEIERQRAEMERIHLEAATEKTAKEDVAEEYELYKRAVSKEDELQQAILDKVKEEARELNVRMQVMETEYVQQLALIKNLQAENGLLSSKQAHIYEKLENAEKESEERRVLIEQLRSKIATVTSVAAVQVPEEDAEGRDGAQHCDHSEQCQTLVQALEARLQERQAEIENLNNELANSYGNITLLHDESLRYNDMMMQTVQERFNQSLIDQTNALQREIDSLKTEKIISEQKVSRLEAELEEYKQQNVEYKTGISEVTDDTVIIDDNIPQLFDASKIFTASSATNADILDKKKVAQLQSPPNEEEIQRSEELQARYDDRVEHWRSQLEDAQDELKKMEHLLSEKNAQIDTLNAKLNIVNQQMDVWLQQYAGEKADLQMEISLRHTEIAALKAELISAKEIADTLTTERGQQNLILESRRLQIDSLEAEVKNIDDSDLIRASKESRSNHRESRSHEDNLQELGSIETSTTQQSRQVSTPATEESVDQPECMQSKHDPVEKEMQQQIKPDVWDDPSEKFSVDVESWGWNAEEGLDANEQHLSEPTLLIPNAEERLRAQIRDLEDKIKDLEAQNIKFSEESKASQIKNGKLVKKLKEYKVQTENLQHQLKTQKQTDSFFDLDTAIEEELKTQIANLEKALNEIKEEKKNIAAEKEAVLKRLDVVMLANERYMEMKEKQDMEVEVLRIQNKELGNKVQSLEWRLEENMINMEEDISSSQREAQIDFSKSSEADTSIAHSQLQKGVMVPDTGDFEQTTKKYKEEIDDLRDELEALATENEQLQHFLEEQKATMAHLESKATHCNTEEFNEKINTLNNQNAQLQGALNTSKEEYDVLRKQYEQSLIDASDQVKAMQENNDILKMEFGEQIEILKVENLHRALEDKKILEDKLNALMYSEEKLISANASLTEVTELLNIRVQEAADLKQELQNQYVEKQQAEATLQSEIENLTKKMDEKKQELETLRRAFDDKEHELVQRRSVETVSAIVSEATQELVQKHAIEIEEKDKELHELAEKLAAVQSTIEEHVSKQWNNEAKLETQQLQIIHLNENLTERDSIIHAIKADVNSISEKLREKQQELMQCEEEKSKLVVELEKYSADVQYLQSQLKTAEAVTVDIQEYNSRIHNLEQQVQVLKSEKASILLQYDRERETYQADLESDKQQIDTLRYDLQEKTEQLHHLNAELCARENDSKRIEAMMMDKNTLLEMANQELNEKRTEVEKLRSEQPQSFKTIDGLPVFRMGGDNNDATLQSTTIDELKAQMEAKQRELEHLKHVMHENTYPMIIQEMQDRINCLYNEKATLEASLIEKQEQVNHLTQRIDEQSQEHISKEEVNSLSRERRSAYDQNEIARLQNQLHAKEQEINELRYVIAEKDSQLHLQVSMEPQSDDFELRETIERLTGELYSKEQEVQTLKATIAELKEQILYLKDLEKLSEESKNAIEKLTSEKELIRIEADRFLNKELENKEAEIDEIKRKLSEENRKLLAEVCTKNDDVKNLQTQLLQLRDDYNKLEQKENQLMHATDDLAEKERRLTELSVTKEAELHNLKVQIREKEERIEELLILSAEEEKQLDELRRALTNRETEMVTLKELLQQKISEYELIKHALKKDVSVIEAAVPKSSETVQTTDDRDNKETISSELNLALYMLHQRDVRCEELTHELMQLLEERDTLQLRLSNAIRVNEELRRASSVETCSIKDSSSILQEMVEPIVEQPSPSKSEGPIEIAKEAIDVPIEDKEALALKLSQLHSVSHMKDVRLKDDRELRHTQQMSLLAHRDVLNTLPPEAAARLVSANYTLSRDVQSQSSVLLNWLWGKSTPKVVHM